MKTTQFIATAVTAAVLGTAGVSIAGATTGTTNSQVPSTVTPTTTAAVAGKPAVRHPRARALARLRAIRLAAKRIGITPTALRTSLRDGQTIAAVADAHHVAPQSVIDALVTAGRARIAKALSQGRITAAQASELNAALPNRAAEFVNSWLPKDHH